MSKATPGKQYVVQTGDTLQSIAAQAYGDAEKWTRIFAANQSILISPDPVPGTILIIPRLAENKAQQVATNALQLKDKTAGELTIIIDGIELAVESASIFTAIDTLADGCTCQIAWEPGADPALDAVLLPYSFAPAAVYIGNDLIINGRVYTIATSETKNRSIKIIEIWSLTADVIDSNIKPPYEATDITLRERAENLIKPLGLNVIYDIAEDEFFDRVTANPTDTIFGHLASLSKQRGTLITSTPAGDVLFTRADLYNIVGTLQEGDPSVTEWAARFDGRQRFNAYKAIAQSPGENANIAVSIDDNVPVSRSHTFSVNDTTVGNIQTAADWRKTKQIADALTLALPVSSWFAPNGSLYRKNSGITIISPTIHVPNGFTFLIRRLEYRYSNDGQIAVLHLIPPQVYSGGELVEPWS